MEKNEIADLLDDLDPPYRSRQEMQIGGVLDQYGIPFFYRQPTIIYNQGTNEVWKPSFSLYNMGVAVVDYAASEEDVLSRGRIYQYNQIPAVVLGPRDLEQGDWDRRSYNELKQLKYRALDTIQYTGQRENPRQYASPQ